MAETSNPLLSMQGIYKAFPGVQALENVDFTLERGEIHALMGGNGAGKSTLIKVLTGVDTPDAGVITLDGQEVHVRSPQQGQRLGITTVYQEINLCPNLTVAENILIGWEPHRFGGVDWNKMNREAVRILHSLGVEIDVTRTLGSYSVALQQMVAIARALWFTGAKVLILDEPTSSLDIHETRQLFEVMNKLRKQGMGIVFVTHFIDQVYEISDRITVLRNGRLVGTHKTADLPAFELIALMIGRSLVELEDVTKIKAETSQHIAGEALVQARGAGHAGAIEPFDLDLHAGEVVGLAGLLGSGRTEMAQLFFGVDKPDSGSITMNGQPITAYSPSASIARGIALCPEDRKAEGILGDLGVRENIILAMQAGRGWFNRLGTAEQYAIADKYIKALNISTPSPDQPVKNLSGGNQQKVILARWLATNPRLLILDEPTRGIDVGAKAEIQKLVLALAEDGKACLFISSELEEVLRTSHRVVVLRDREKVAEFSGGVGEDEIMKAIAGSEA